MQSLITTKVLCRSEYRQIVNTRKSQLTGQKLNFIRYALSYLSVISLVLLGLNTQAQGTLPHEETLRLEGVPNDIEVTRSFRQTTDVFYTMPAGITIFDYNDVDKVYMEPRGTDERVVVGRNVHNDMILIYEVIDPATQFKPAVLGHKHVIFSDGFVRFYDGNGAILYIDTTTLQPIDEFEYEPEVEYNFNDLGDGVFELSDDFMIQWIDTVSGIVITRYYDEGHEWKASSFEFYSANGVINTFPVLEISYELATTILGETVYRVTTTKYSEIYEDDRIESRTIGNNRPDSELIQIENLEILPNPATDYISVGFPGIDKPTDVEVKIFGMNGQLMHEETILTDGFHTLTLPAAWPAGLYILNARADQAVWVDKFVKK